MYPSIPNILSDEEFLDRITEIEDFISSHSRRGTFPAFDGQGLAYQALIHPESRGSIVILHGFTEYYLKYNEMIWYMYQMGYSVFIYDQRSHGLSGRYTDDCELTHVEDFEDYARDLDAFMTHIVLPAQCGPVHLYAHSMGGAVAALYLRDRSDAVARCLLSSPMISPLAHSVPHWYLRAMIRRHAAKAGWMAPFRYSTPYRADPSYERSSDKSYARFVYHIRQRNSNELYHNALATNHWMYQALSLRKKLLGCADSITAEVLILSSEKDRVVKRSAQKQFVRRLVKGRLITLYGAKHTAYTDSPPMLKQFYGYMFSFFGEESSR